MASSSYIQVSQSGESAGEQVAELKNTIQGFSRSLTSLEEKILQLTKQKEEAESKVTELEKEAGTGQDRLQAAGEGGEGGGGDVQPDEPEGGPQQKKAG